MTAQPVNGSPWISETPASPTRGDTSSHLVPRLLRLEGLAIAVAAVLAYRWAGGSWGLYLGLWLLPDLSLLTYLSSEELGARLYNATHTLLGPLALLCWSLTSGPEWGLLAALVWISHIGLDRALGFGLKYPTGFSDHHLSRLQGVR